MIKVTISSAAFVLVLATSAQAMSPVPLHQSDGLITQVRSNRARAMRWNEALGRCATHTARRDVRRGVVSTGYLQCSGSETPNTGSGGASGTRRLRPSANFEESVKWTTYCRIWCSGSAP